MSQGCIHAACMIIQNMDTCVDPCENFYEFACGNFVKYRPMPDDKSTVNIPHSISDQLETKLRIILEDENSNNDVRAFKLAKKLYRNCMNLGNSGRLRKKAYFELQVNLLLLTFFLVFLI